MANKKYAGFLVIAGLIAGAPASAIAATADGTATATVIQPITVSETTPLAYGALAVGTTGGTVTIDTAGTATASADIDLISSARSAATFTITGEPLFAIAVSLNTAGAQLDDATAGGGGTPMTLGSFTNTGLPVSLNIGGSATFDVGATLNVNASQTPGDYSTGTGDGSPYTVTVNYN